MLNLFAIYWFAYWETIPFHFIWISLTLLYGFRSWPTGPTMWILGAVMVTTASGIGLDVWRGTEPAEELTEVPLMAAVFVATVWHSQRKLAAERSVRLIGEQNARLLTDQRQFLQDAAHQLRTPITIALGHAELLATDLSGEQQGEDIGVVIGELNRLRRISERLLLIASAGDPAFLHAENVQLDQLIADHVRRWRPTISQHLRIGRLDAVTVRADRERLGLALDALIENAVRHTDSDGGIQLSVIRDYPGMPVRIVVADAGSRDPGGPAAVHLRPVPHQRWRAVTGDRPGSPPGARGSPRARRRRDRPQRARQGQRVRAGPAAARPAGPARRAGRPDGSGGGGDDDDDGRPRECQAMSTMSLPSAARQDGRAWPGGTR